MFPFDGPYLRIQTPITINGTVPKSDPKTRMVQYKETHLPITAKAHLEKENELLPEHLRHIIEIVDEDEGSLKEIKPEILEAKTPPKKVVVKKVEEEI